MRFARKLFPLALVLAAAPWQPVAAQGQQKPTVVIVVRHAEKDTSDPAARDPLLTPAGEQRARDLVRTIRRRNVDAIVTTHLRRNVLTAKPAADSLGITPDVFQAVSDGRQTGIGMAQRVRERYLGKTVLVVGHSNTVAATIEALGGPKLNDICDSSHSNLFMLVLYPNGRSPRFTHTHYGNADPPGGDTCRNGLVQ